MRSPHELLVVAEQNRKHELNSAEAKAVQLYETCMDDKRLKEIAMSDWFALVEKIGGWQPSNSLRDPMPLEQTLNTLYAVGGYPIVWVGVAIDEMDTSRYVITVNSTYSLNFSSWMSQCQFSLIRSFTFIGTR